MKLEISLQLNELRAKRETAESKLEDLCDAGEDKWEETKAGIDGAFQGVRDGVRAAVSQFK
jgi:hypothetical protein